MQRLTCYWDLFSEIVSVKKAMRKKHSFVSRLHRTLYMKTKLRFIVAGDINFPQKHCCATPNDFL
jgi:hypothetical protein